LFKIRECTHKINVGCVWKAAPLLLPYIVLPWLWQRRCFLIRSMEQKANIMLCASMQYHICTTTHTLYYTSSVNVCMYIRLYVDGVFMYLLDRVCVWFPARVYPDMLAYKFKTQHTPVTLTHFLTTCNYLLLHTLPVTIKRYSQCREYIFIFTYVHSRL